jgi:hypothetical protein
VNDSIALLIILYESFFRYLNHNCYKNMNLWKEPYPSSLSQLIEKCERLMGQFEQHLVETQWDLAICKPNPSLQEPTLIESEGRKGLYTFFEKGATGIRPLYLGISRDLKNRLRNHGWGKLHTGATLAYLMAEHEGVHSGPRKEITHQTLEFYQKRIRALQVAILLDPSDYDLYFMEVYFAGKTKTPWNRFRTH